MIHRTGLGEQHAVGVAEKLVKKLYGNIQLQF